MMNRGKLEHILAYARQQKQFGSPTCRIPPGDMVEIMERLLAQPVSSGYKLPGGWMACSDRMPDADGAYWCWFGKEEPSVIQQRVCIWNDRNHEWCDSAVTHWMPLPAAPEGGNENN